MDFDRREFDRIYTYYADRYPPLITIEQAAEIAQVKLRSIYEWSHLGRLDGCKSKQGRELRLRLYAYLQFLVIGRSL